MFDKFITVVNDSTLLLLQCIVNFAFMLSLLFTQLMQLTSVIVADVPLRLLVTRSVNATY